ncbi:MAG: ABC transporter permease [Christensenellales bacterium]|jgi:putative aldouronate transport system permease protein
MKRQVIKPPRFSSRLRRDIGEYGGAYVLALAVLAYYILFHYVPMSGAIIAFKDFSPRRGIWGSNWVGLKHFEGFFGSFYFSRVVKNTLVISLSTLVFSFPLPVLFALSINEVKSHTFKKTVQTISYMPHFISMVVVCSMVRLFTAGDSFIVQIMTFFGYDNTGANLLNDKSMFVPIYVISGIWQNLGWDCIIYLAALTAIDPELYEAARVDGANRLRQTLHVTIPGILGTVIMLLILRIGSLMSVGHEKIILLYNERVYETADVISSYVYRRGLVQGDWSFGTAVGLFNSVINFVLVLSANALSNRISGYGLW